MSVKNSGEDKKNRSQRNVRQRKSIPSGKGAETAAEAAVKKTAEKTAAGKKRLAAAAESAIRRTAEKVTSSKRKQNTKEKKPVVKAYFLGGLNEIGKNLTVFECEDEMIVVDCGMTFPSEDMLGIDMVIPDFTFIEQNAAKIRGIFLTHGHEDHIGSLPYLFKKVRFPLYGGALTLGLVKVKMKEHGITGVDYHEVSPGKTVKTGVFSVEFIHVNHSISDAVALAIKTPAGVLVHTGDFKIDCTPEKGEMIDLARFAELGKKGVLALFADSTNAERPGYTPTEQTVSATFDNLFFKAKSKRIIIATFASNISRVQQIINCAKKYGRKVIFSGRSMVNVMGTAAELGKLDIPAGILVDIDQINQYPPNKIVLVTTGSQGEPMSALTRMAFADHRKVTVGPGDVIIISARPIPGNEKTVGTVVDELMKHGCEVIYESMYEVHVSGHARQEELKIIQALVKPKYFIPVHGEQKHLQKHAGLAESMGMPRKNIFIGDVGSALEIGEDHMKQLPDVPAGQILVDGLGVGDVGSIVLRDRKHLGEDGLIVIVCSVDSGDGELVSGPDVVSRGFVYVKESEELIEEIRKIVLRTVERDLEMHSVSHTALKTDIRDNVSKMLYSKTRRSPMILPIIMEV